MPVSRIAVLAIIIVVPPGALLAVAAAMGWVGLASTWEWISWLLVSTAAWAAFLRAFVEVERRVSEWSDGRRLELTGRGVGTPEQDSAVALGQSTTATELRRLLTDHFDLEELRTLCFDLRVDYDSLRGEGKEAKARELLAYFQRRDQLSRLASYICQHRTDIGLT